MRHVVQPHSVGGVITLERGLAQFTTAIHVCRAAHWFAQVHDALVEFLVRHIPETRFLIDGVSDSTVKGIAAGACSYLLVGGDLTGIVDLWLETGDLTHFEWGK